MANTITIRDQELSLIEKFLQEKQMKTEPTAEAPSVKNTQETVKKLFMRTIANGEKVEETVIREGYYDRLIRGKFHLASNFRKKHWEWLDFTPEINEAFIYLLETWWIFNIHYASRLIEELWEWLDFSEDIKKHETDIKKTFCDLNMWGFKIFNKAIFDQIDFTDETKDAFINCFDKWRIFTAVWIMDFWISYWIPEEFFRDIISKKAKRIKLWFLFHLKKWDFAYSERIKEKFWAWLDFWDEIIKWYDHFVNKSYFDMAEKLQKIFWEWVDFDKEVQVSASAAKPRQVLAWSYIPPTDQEYYRSIWAL